MSFVQIEFLWFMAILYLAYWGLRNRFGQNLLLAGGSAVFYGWIHPWFLGLLYFSAVLDYTMGRLMKARPQQKGTFLALSMMGNLGMLGFFKYFDFFVVNVATAMSAAGVPTNMSTLGILLPVGISFYTFQTMSYTIDVYRGQIEPRTNFLDYLVFVTFFPQLVAGPIERASHLLPQVEAPRVFKWDDLRQGFGLAMWGAFKKVAIADTVAPYVDKVFILEEPAGPLLWAAVAGFSVQILADFSGYTDMARGIGRILGFELVRNFDHPYLATNTPDFWRKWHMSLSFWIRDYLLVPLLGDEQRITVGRFLFAVFTSFLLLGLWHGAAWNFVLLGVYNAFWVVFYVLAIRQLPDSIKKIRYGWVAALAFHAVPVGAIGLLLFRETHLDRILQHLTTNPFVASHDEWIATSVVVAVTALVAMPLFIALAAEKTILPRLERSPWYLPVQTSLWASYAMVMFVFYRTTTRDFIYFQF